MCRVGNTYRRHNVTLLGKQATFSRFLRRENPAPAPPRGRGHSRTICTIDRPGRLTETCPVSCQLVAVTLLALAGPWAAPARAQGPDVAPPVILLAVVTGKPEVGQEVTVSWQVTGAVSVSVRRDGQASLPTLQGRELSRCRTSDRLPGGVVASNRAGSTSEELTVRPVTFGSIAPLSSFRGWKPPAGCR